MGVSNANKELSTQIIDCGDRFTVKLSLTASMVSNYVKKGLVSNPVKKQYSREQISYLIYISIAKVSVSIDNIN